MDSSQDEIGASAILGAQLDEELGGGPVQVKHIVPLVAFSFHEFIFILTFMLLKYLLSSGLLIAATSSLTFTSFYSFSSHLMVFPLLLLSSSVSDLFCVFRLSVLL